VNLTSME